MIEQQGLSAAEGLESFLLRTERVPAASVVSVKEESARILKSCVPVSREVGRLTGLVCGYVQSGKTLSMTMVTAMGRDLGYRLFIYIAGGTKNLVDQTWSRLSSDLREAASPWSWLLLKNPKGRTSIEPLTACVREWKAESAQDRKDARVAVIVVMKHHKWLAHLTDVIASLDLDGCPTIIFDDEADQASLNTRPDEKSGPSTTYQRIHELRAAIPHNSYLQYTATPQAPLLISQVDTLSADFAEVISPGGSYTGGKSFFGSEREGLVRDIPSDDICDSPNDIHGTPPESLVEALRFFMLGVSIGELDGDSGHRSMLVHPSQRTAVHDAYVHWCTSIVSGWAKALLNPSDDSSSYGAIVGEFRKSYEDEFGGVPRVPPFGSIKKQLPLSVNRVSLTKVNKDGEEVKWDNAYAHILVGGEKLGRGYTVEGLTVTYMPRGPGGFTADTIQQRARFFGYRKSYLSLCRVYLPASVREIYEGYLRHEERMRKDLASYSGRSLKDWRRAFYLESNLKPTRNSILSTPYMRPRLPDGWCWASRPHIDEGSSSQNTRLVEHVLSHLVFSTVKGFERHRVATVRLQGVFSNFLAHLAWASTDDSVKYCSANCHIADLLDDDLGAECSVFLMDDGKVRTRSLDRRDRVKQLFQGRSSAGADRYPGDRSFQDPDRLSVQIHHLSLEVGTAKPWVGYVVALRLPEVHSTIVQAR